MKKRQMAIISLYKTEEQINILLSSGKRKVQEKNMRTDYRDAETIIRKAINEVLPDKAVRTVLSHVETMENVYVVAVGKAAWKMAHTCQEILGSHIRKGIILTKYGHAEQGLPGFEIVEAGHPIPDSNSIMGTQKIIDMVKSLTEKDNIIFLLSGGGSSLFEKPVPGITLADIQEVTQQCLKCGASITEINTIRKRLSDVKGGKFAAYCAPARICAIVLSDILGDKLDMIASGPAFADTSTCEEAFSIIEKYNLKLKQHILSALGQETPRIVDNVETYLTGSVSEFCRAAAKYSEELGYKSYILSNTLDCEAKEAGKFIASIARTVMEKKDYSLRPPCAIIVGGETIVRVSGEGKGGRNQEIVISAAQGIRDLENVVIFSISSDGTDGPTDAAGGIVDGKTCAALEALGISCEEALKNNDTYHALEKTGGLVRTGATGTNVNDIAVILCK